MLRRIERLFTLLCTLSDGSTMEIEELSSRFDTSRRTTFRDLETLRTAGVKFRVDRPKGKHLIGLDLTEHRLCTASDEDLLPILMRAAFTAIPSTRKEELAARAAIKKVVSVLGAPVNGWLADFLDHYWTDPDNAGAECPYVDFAATVIEAIGAGSAISIDLVPPAPVTVYKLNVAPIRIKYDLAKGGLLDAVRVENHASIRIPFSQIDPSTAKKSVPIKLARNVRNWTVPKVDLS